MKNPSHFLERTAKTLGLTPCHGKAADKHELQMTIHCNCPTVQKCSESYGQIISEEIHQIISRLKDKDM